MMTMMRLAPLAAVPLLAGPLLAQQRPPTAPPAQVREFRLSEPLALLGNPSGARLGITLGEADTAGIAVVELSEKGPAAAAGLKVGDRLLSIDGVSLRMTPADAADPALSEMMHRRLQRTMADKKPGDEVTLRVLSGGTARALTMKAVTAQSLMEERVVRLSGASVPLQRNRAALGVTLGSAPSRRDTLGVLIIGVTTDGPAERAGLIEGDRIARINGVDVRVPREDAGDALLSRARSNRVQQILAELEPGAEVTLSVVTAGRTRELRITTVAANTLPAATGLSIMGERLFEMPVIPESGALPRAREALERAQREVERIRIAPATTRIRMIRVD